MPRIARIVAPGQTHRVALRGHRRMATEHESAQSGMDWRTRMTQQDIYSPNMGEL
jgi:hypothetical protein